MKLCPSALMVVAVMVGSTGCGGEPTVDLQTEEETIRALDRQWQAAVNAKDVQAAAAFFASDAVLMPANGPLALRCHGILPSRPHRRPIPGGQPGPQRGVVGVRVHGPAPSGRSRGPPDSR